MSERKLRDLSRKKFKLGLFFFEIDKQTSIFDTKYIISEDIEIWEGNTVRVKWEDECLNAKIIKLSGV